MWLCWSSAVSCWALESASPLWYSPILLQTSSDLLPARNTTTSVLHYDYTSTITPFHCSMRNMLLPVLPTSGLIGLDRVSQGESTVALDAQEKLSLPVLCHD